MKKTALRIILAGLLAVGVVVPAVAEIVDFGDGIRWDTAGLQRAAAGALAQAGHEYDQQMHASQ